MQKYFPLKKTRNCAILFRTKRLSYDLRGKTIFFHLFILLFNFKSKQSHAHLNILISLKLKHVSYEFNYT